MQYYPMTASATFPWEENDLSTTLLDFANRDKFNTETTTSLPRNVRAVGEPLNKYYNERSHTEFPNSDSYLSIPSWCVFSMEHVFAPVKTEGAPDWNRYVERIDNTVFETLTRDLSYTVRLPRLDFEPIDVQWSQITLEEIMAHLANLLRAMDAYNWVAVMNNYGANSAQRILNVLGFNGGIGGGIPLSSGNGFRDLVDYVNKFIIGQLNQQNWFWDFFPVTRRKAALYSKVFMDAEDSEFYASTYVFKPRNFYMPGYDTESGTNVFKLYRTDVPNTLFGYAYRIAEAVRFLIDDEDFANIQIAFDAIKKKQDKLGDDVAFSKDYFPFYPYFGRPFKFEYNPNILLAIHNMTIINGLEVSDIEQVVRDEDKKNQLVQTFSMPDYTNTSDPMGVRLDNVATVMLMKMKQPLDMPEAWGIDDWDALIAATQFTVASWPDQPETERMLSPKVLGLEVCGGAKIFKFADSNPAAFQMSDCYNHIFLKASTLPTDGRHMCDVAQFSCFPLQPVVRGTGTNVPPAEFTTLGYLNDLNHISYIDFITLQDIKEQLYYNAYCYPLSVPDQGSFEGMKKLGEMYMAKHAANVITHEQTSSNGSSSGASDGASKQTDRSKAGKPKSE